ncbi:MAG TPA: ATP-dependent DNA helicase, partial [Desulfobulbus sp.]|nr:ATP-dependent DNA helicase [Desulfobulbus sp.]
GRFPLQKLLADDSGLLEKRDGLLRALDQLAEVLEQVGKGQEPWEQYGIRCQELQQQLEFITTESFDDLPSEDIRYIHWFERREKNLILSATPIDVSGELQESLFSSVSGCVFTSATLTTGGDFKYFFKRLGLPEETPSLSFASPFNYEEQTLLYVPDNSFPEPVASGYQQALHERILALVEAAGGRALVLFTSFKAMDAAWAALEDELEFPLLCQGSAPRHELLRRFSDETRAVLFAVASFWEGVDIPGESLSLVIIDKLPFEVPSDPVIMARLDRIKAGGGNPFFEFQVPRAILSLRQGVGRLMRSSTDHGVVAILDVRLFSKGYGRRFRNSLPPSPLVRTLEDVVTFFEKEDERDQRR